MNKLKNILESDFSFSLLALLLVLLGLSLTNYFYFIPLIIILYKIRNDHYFNYILLVLISVLLFTITKNSISYKTNGYFIVRDTSKNSSIIGHNVVFKKLEPLSLYYVEGTKEEFKKPEVIGEFDSKNYYLAKDVRQVLTPTTLRLVRSSKLNQFLDNYLTKLNLADKTKTYLETILLARDSLGDTKELYSTIGISHIFSVSGLHITLFSLLVLKLLSIFFKEETCLDLISIFLLVYMVLACFSISVVRASLLFIFKNIFKKIKINISNLNILSLVMILLLILNLHQVNLAEFKLSFITSFAILYFNDKKYDAITISLICYLITLPIIINLNHSLSLLSPLYNLFYISYFTGFMLSSSILALVNLDIFGLFPLSIDFIESLSAFLNMYDVSVSFRSLHPLLIILYYYLFYLMTKFRFGLKYIIFYFTSILSLISISNFRLNQVVMIDVDQGLSIYIHDEGKDYLFDTGGLLYMDVTSKRVIPFLKSLNVKDLNLFLSHAHNDHIGGFQVIKDNFKLKKIYIAKKSSNKLLELVYPYNATYLEYGDKIDQKFEVIAPVSFDERIENNNSLVLDYDFNQDNILLTGDTELDYIYRKADILFLGHHGSKTSTNSKVIETVRPRVVLTSSGKGYGHPSTEVVELLKFYKIPNLITEEVNSVYIYDIFNRTIILSNQELRFIMGYLD